MRRSRKRLFRVSIALFYLLAWLFVPANVYAQSNISQVQAKVTVDRFSRFAGIDQYETAAKIAEAGWPGTTDAIVLSAGMQANLIDAMSAGPLAAKLKAPILLTDGGNQLNRYARTEIVRLQPKKVYITSGSAVIKPAVLEELKSMGITPVELGGYDQYETAVNIAKEMQSLGDKITKIAVVAGWVRPADALSIGSIAASEQIPVLSTTKKELPAKVKEYLDGIQGSITDSYVVGGTAVVSDAVKNSLPGLSQRYYGNTKYDTNLAVLKKCDGDLSYHAVYVANGETLVDALAGVPLAAQAEAPIILTNQTIDPSLLNYAKTNLSPYVVALGGDAVVTQQTLNELSSAAVVDGTDQTIGPDDSGTPEELSDTLLISGDNSTLQNVNEDYSVYLKGNNLTLNNVTIKGTLFIDPGANGTVSLNHVTAAQTVILSGAENGISLNDVTFNDLRVMSPNKVVIAPTGNSTLTNTTVSTAALLDAAQGNWGPVHISRTGSPETSVELKGTFSHDVFVTSPSIVKADPNAAVAKIIVMPQNSGLITLDGTFDVVQIEKKAQVSLTAETVVNHLVTHAQTSLNVEKGATVGHLYNGDFSVLTGDGAQDLPAADLNDPYPVLNPEGYQSKNPALKISAPQDGAVLDYNDVTVAWSAVPGATGYTIDINDQDNPWRYLADFTSNIPAGTTNFTFTKDRITQGHHYVITVYYNMPIDPDIGYGSSGSLPPVHVQIGHSSVVPLVITSPASGASFSFNTPIPLRWNAPADAGNLEADVVIQGQIGVSEFSGTNGQDISQALTPGKNHVTVSLMKGDEVVYQGAVDITMIPSSSESDTPDILTPTDGKTIDPNRPLTVTWKPVTGATDYNVIVSKEGGNIYSPGAGIFHAGTLTSFQLSPLSDGKYNIFVRAEVDNMLRDGNVITVNAPKADPDIVSQPPLNIIPLQLVSPANNATFSGNDPVILKWNTPKYAENMQVSVRITNSRGYIEGGFWNGENLNREIQPDENVLVQGVNHITVTLKNTGSIMEYQGSVDIIYNP